MKGRPAFVDRWLKRMADLGLVEPAPYQRIKARPRAETLHIDLLRKHRLLERLLVDFLDLPWDDVHDLACKLEHYISMDVADRIEKSLGYPTTCPHGNPVDATIEDGSLRLSDMEINVPLTIVKVT